MYNVVLKLAQYRDEEYCPSITFGSFENIDEVMMFVKVIEHNSISTLDFTIAKVEEE